MGFKTHTYTWALLLLVASEHELLVANVMKMLFYGIEPTKQGYRKGTPKGLGLLKMFSENQFLKSPPTIKLPTVLECFCFVSLVCLSTSTLRWSASTRSNATAEALECLAFCQNYTLHRLWARSVCLVSLALELEQPRSLGRTSN